jgi:naphtho-gamma-pyrone polyketide synthase
VIEENNSVDKSTLLVESDLHDPRMTPIVTRHKVNTAMLCLSSLYADIALTIGKHIIKPHGMVPEQTGLDCRRMVVTHPLIVEPNATSQLLRVSAESN